MTTARRFMSKIGKASLSSALVLALAFGGAFVGSCARAPEEALAATGDFAQVDNSTVFCEGYYLNQQGKFQDPSFQVDQFTVSGGRVVPLNPSTNEKANIYETSNIWPMLVGLEETSGIPGWGFIANGSFNDSGTGARGAYVEMTYKEVGTLESASDETFEPLMVDIKVRYTILGSITPADAAKKGAAYGFRNKPVIQFTDCFGYGTFQFGITAMETTYTFLDSNTHQLVDIDSIYYTKTSMDKGEGFSVDDNLIKAKAGDPGAYVASGAPRTLSDTNIADNYRFKAIQGSYLYYGTHSPFERSGIGFSGIPEVWGKNGNKYDYQDTIGAPTYYWRSASVLLDMQDKASVTITVTAAGSESWTHGWDIDNSESNLGSMYQTANFIPLTNPRPRVPVKTINSGTSTVGGVRIGDTVHYEISQKVGSFGQTSISAYESMVYTDPLPGYVRYAEGSGRMLDPDGIQVPAQAGRLSYDQNRNTLTYTFAQSFLESQMKYRGGRYTLAFDAIVVDQPERDFDQPLSDNNNDGLFTDGTQGRLDDRGGAGIVGRVANQSSVSINGYTQTSNIVYYEPVEPILDIEKHADLTNSKISPVNDYQFLSATEGNPNSTVRFTGSLKDIIDGTRAKNITISDALPNGLSLIAGSVKLSGFDGAETVRINESEAGWSALIPQLEAWSEVQFSYECKTTENGNGHEVINTIHAWATNCELGSPGGENSYEKDDGEIYINDPNLVVRKAVTESPIQNDDYQETLENQREEYRVGDVFEYTVTLENDVPGTFGQNVWLVDEEMPAEFALASDISVTGVDYNNQGKSFSAPATGSCEIAKYPYTGNTNVGVNSDGVHGETKYVTSSFSLIKQDYSDGNWGWALHVDYLPHGKVITVKWSVRALSGANGWEVFNKAFAIAGNQPRDRFESDVPIVWINSPDFNLDKHVTKTQDTYSVGDNAKYQVELFGLKTPGTLARKTTLQDVLRTEGVVINELAAVKVYDQRKNSNSIVDRVHLYACDDPVTLDEDGAETNEPAWHQGERLRYDDGSDQSWHIDMSQVYDEAGYWVCDYTYRFVWKDGALKRIDDERNPVRADGYSDSEGSGDYRLMWDHSEHVLKNYSYLKVEYEATINDHALENLVMVNDATVNSIEQLPVTDRAGITVVGANLDITKTSNDGGWFVEEDVVDYEVTVTNLTPDTTAQDVQIHDAFTTAKAGAVEIIDGSVELTTDTGIPVGLWSITWKDNEAGSHIGFEVDTNIDLAGGRKIILRYKVRHLTDNGTTFVENTARAWADNSPEVRARYKTHPTYDELLRPMGVDKPAIVKLADRESASPGERIHYTVTINAGNSGLTNAEVIDVRDERLLLDEASIRISGAPATYGYNASKDLELLETYAIESESMIVEEVPDFPEDVNLLYAFSEEAPVFEDASLNDEETASERMRLLSQEENQPSTSIARAFPIGAASAGKKTTIEYDCIVAGESAVGSSLLNEATLTADDVYPISDMASVNIEGNNLLGTMGSAVNNALGASLGKAGDEAIGAILAALIAASIAALVAFLLRRVRSHQSLQAARSTRQDGSHVRS